MRIGLLTSEMILSIGGQSVGGSNGNADELTNWDTRIGNIEVAES